MSRSSQFLKDRGGGGGGHRWNVWGLEGESFVTVLKVARSGLAR